MARARNIKPGFFLNDDLASIDPLGRLLFAGLWTLADKNGRLEDRPPRIKIQVLPYDNCNVDEQLGSLAAKGFIERYTVDGAAYIQISNFVKHQNPHPREKEGEIPPPPAENPCSSTGHEKALPSREISGQAEKSNIPAGLIPFPSCTSDTSTSEERTANLDFQDIINSYHLHCPGLPRVVTITHKLKRSLSARWKILNTIDQWIDLFSRVEASDFLSGRSGKWKGCTFDWLIQESNITKVLKGAYDNSTSEALPAKRYTHIHPDEDMKRAWERNTVNLTEEGDP
jgi:hypothetical protein